MGQFLGVVWAIQKHWQSLLQPSLPPFVAKEIIQSPMMSCSRRDHLMRQANANRHPENFGRRQCGLLAGKGVMGVHSAGEV